EDQPEDKATSDAQPTNEGAPRRKKKKKKVAKGLARERSASAPPVARAGAPGAAKPNGVTGRIALFAILALAVGLGVGWLVRGARGGDVTANPDTAAMSPRARG